MIGANAAVARTLGGGSATVFPPYTVSPLDGIRAAFGPDVEVEFARGGRLTRRVPAAPARLLRRPDGHPGVRLRLLAADGRQLRVEDRTAAGYAWLTSYGDGLAFPDVARLEVETRLTAPASGTYLVGGSGLGSFQLTLDGAVVAEERLDLPGGADPVEGMMRPPQLIHPIVLAAGDQVELLLRCQPAGVGDFGDAPVAKVAFQLNADLDCDDGAELDQAVAMAASADVAIVVVGTTEEVESEGFDRTSLALPGRQDELVTRVARANPRTVVAVNAGAPTLLPWADEVPAILLCWFPGQEFGNALADVLTGATEPRGRLPVTWPASPDGLPSTTPRDGVLRYDEGLFIGYRWYDRERRQPRFCFGHGLGYTTWEYLAASAAPGSGMAVAVRLRNTGLRPGREVVQVYASKPDSGVLRPDRWLAGWAAVEARPGEAVTATITVATRAFEHWDSAAHQWVIEPGPFNLHIGSSSRTLPLQMNVSPTPADQYSGSPVPFPTKIPNNGPGKRRRM